MNKYIYSLVWTQFTQRKLRSALTMIGILIGISALVSLVLLSGALKQGVTGQLDAFGSDTILVAPLAALGGQGGPSGTGIFSTDDVETVSSVPGVLKTNAILLTNTLVKYGRETARIDVRAPEINENDGESITNFLDVEVQDGRVFSQNERGVVCLGYKAAKDIFDKEVFVGNTLRIEDKKFQVVCIFEEKGEQNTDFDIFTTIADGRNIVGDSQAVSAIRATVGQGEDLELMEERISRALERDRGKEDFGITTPAAIQDSIGSFLAVVDFVVFSIALISLFVASLGIMNSLYTSVMQRTKEIGTMKAVGAKNSQILMIFILESSILGFLGGLAGILLGLFFGFIFITGINSLGFVPLSLQLDWVFLGGALLFSVGLGVISGLLPAIQASKLKVIDALRHE